MHRFLFILALMFSALANANDIESSTQTYELSGKGYLAYKEAQAITREYFSQVEANKKLPKSQQVMLEPIVFK